MKLKDIEIGSCICMKLKRRSYIGYVIDTGWKRIGTMEGPKFVKDEKSNGVAIAMNRTGEWEPTVVSPQRILSKGEFNV